MIRSNHPDTEVRARSNELLNAAGYKTNESLDATAQHPLTKRAVFVFRGIGIAFAVLLAVSLHATELDYSNRVGVLVRFAQLSGIVAVVLEGIRLTVPKDRQGKTFPRVCSAVGNFALAYCTSLLLIIAVV